VSIVEASALPCSRISESRLTPRRGVPAGHHAAGTVLFRPANRNPLRAARKGESHRGRAHGLGVAPKAGHSAEAATRFRGAVRSPPVTRAASSARSPVCRHHDRHRRDEGGAPSINVGDLRALRTRTATSGSVLQEPPQPRDHKVVAIAADRRHAHQHRRTPKGDEEDARVIPRGVGDGDPKPLFDSPRHPHRQQPPCELPRSRRRRRIQRTVRLDDGSIIGVLEVSEYVKIAVAPKTSPKTRRSGRRSRRPTTEISHSASRRRREGEGAASSVSSTQRSADIDSSTKHDAAIRSGLLSSNELSREPGSQIFRSPSH